MLAKIKRILATARDKEAFFERIRHFFPETDYRYIMIKKAYNTAEDEFQHLYRDSGEGYFEHLRCSTLIMVDWLYVSDWCLISAQLLHDLVEDIPSWSIESVRKEFCPQVAELVDWMTKPKGRESDYYTRLVNAPESFWLMKLSDRLHNLMTLWACTPEKRARKIKETREVFLPYARLKRVLAHELEEALECLEKKQPKND